MEELWISREAGKVLDALSGAGIAAWIVGGCVRDMLRGETPKDWDVAAAATPEEIKAALRDFRLIETGIRHGTVTALSEGVPIEVTACRGEGAYTDLRHPSEVTFHRSIREDLSRRDFTVNALAYAPDSGLIDLFDGLKDLRDGVIRCIRRPEDRFSEDALRILRALRFSAVLGYEIEPNTAAAIHSLRENIRAVSAERCAAELSKLLLGDHAAEVLTEYADVIEIVLPVIGPMRGFVHRPEHGGDLWRHSAEPLRWAPKDLAIRFALLLRDCAKPQSIKLGGDYPEHAAQGALMAEQALRELKLPSALIGRVTVLVRHHSALPRPERSAVLRAMNYLGPEVLQDLVALRRADRLAHGEDPREIDALQEKIKELTACGACYQLSQLAVSGDDLKALGYAGREIGQTLQMLLFAVMDGKCENTRPVLEAYLRTQAQSPAQQPPATPGNGCGHCSG